MTDLGPLYNGSAGFKRHGTSEAAAHSVTPSISAAQREILDALTTYGAHTADELAALLGKTPFYMRPRCSELVAKGLIFETGQTRKNASGRSANVFTV